MRIGAEELVVVYSVSEPATQRSSTTGFHFSDVESEWRRSH